MTTRADDYARYDPHASRDLYVLSHRNMRLVEPKPEDEPYQDWIDAGHAGRRQHALQTYRAFASILPEYEDLIDNGRCLNEFLARRFNVSINVIKWLRYRNDRYAQYLVDHFSADQFAILCLWLDRVDKSVRPRLLSGLKWFVLANRFFEWRTGVLDYREPTGIPARGDPDRWERICREIGNAMHRTRKMEHRLLAHTVFVWRSTVGLDVLRTLSPDVAVAPKHIVKLALSPTWNDLRRTGISLVETNAWLKELPANARIENPSYWIAKLTEEEEARRLDAQRRAARKSKIRRIRSWWAARINIAAHLDPQQMSRPHQRAPCRHVIERAQLILTGSYNPGVQPPLAPRDKYPRRRRSAYEWE